VWQIARLGIGVPVSRHFCCLHRSTPGGLQYVCIVCIACLMGVIIRRRAPGRGLGWEQLTLATRLRTHVFGVQVVQVFCSLSVWSCDFRPVHALLQLVVQNVQCSVLSTSGMLWPGSSC
jgi:hypothetical protein